MTATALVSNYRTDATIAPFLTRPGRSSVRSTFQLAADLAMPPGTTAEQAFRAAGHIATDWLQEKFPQNFPRVAAELDSFELEHYGQQEVSCLRIPEDGLWSARLVQPDAPYKDRPAVAGRTWTTELALHLWERKARFGIRVLCASAPYAVEPITLTRPRVVLDMANRLGLSEIRVLDGQPWMLKSNSDLDALLALLVDSRRTMPVILLTQPDKRRWHVKVLDYMLDELELARRMQGLAHVVCMPMALGYAWTDLVGKVWSAYLGAVRTYYPKLDLNEDAPYASPSVLADRIVFWRYNDQEGESAFASFLLDKLAEFTAGKSVDWGKCLFFADARTRRAEIARKRLQAELQKHSQVDALAELRSRLDILQGAHHEEVAALKAKIAEAQSDAKEYDDLASQYKKATEQSERDNQNLRHRNDALRAALEAKTGSSADAELDIPDNYGDMPDWVEKRLAGRLAFHPRAVQGIKKARYGDVALVYQCLLLLANEYRDMRMGHSGAKKAWEVGLQRHELRFGGSITKDRAGEQGETYFVRYPIGSSQRQFLEFHLRRGSTKDDRYCLGIYFFWDKATSQVVVGWLPNHLDTRAT